MPFAAEGPPAGGPSAEEPIMKKGLKYIQTFLKRKPVPFAAEGPLAEGPPVEGPPGEGPPAEGLPAEGPPSGEMLERYSTFLQKKTCAICC